MTIAPAASAVIVIDGGGGGGSSGGTSTSSGGSTSGGGQTVNVPEPGALGMLGLGIGLTGLFLVLRKRERRD